MSVTLENSIDSQFVTTLGARARYYSNDPIVNERTYSNPFKFEFKQYKYAKTPLIYIKLTSYDFWGVRRIVGYGSFQLPNETGKHTLVVNCWRPLKSLESRLRQWFLGGTDEIITNQALGYNSDCKKVSRIGLTTMNAGCLEIKFNIIKYHPHPISKKGAPKIAPASITGLCSQTIVHLTSFRMLLSL